MPIWHRWVISAADQVILRPVLRNQSALKPAALRCIRIVFLQVYQRLRPCSSGLAHGTQPHVPLDTSALVMEDVLRQGGQAAPGRPLRAGRFTLMELKRAGSSPD